MAVVRSALLVVTLVCAASAQPVNWSALQAAGAPSVGTIGVPHSLSLTFLRARPELTYEILASSTLDPDTWEVVATNPGAVSLTQPVTDPVSINPRRFLRLRVTAP